MHIGLITATRAVRPLAGQRGTAETWFASASNIRIREDIEQQMATYVRAAARRLFDRGNIGAAIAWDTVRTFETVDEAEAFGMDCALRMPRSGIVITEPNHTTDNPIGYLIGESWTNEPATPLLDFGGNPVAFPYLAWSPDADAFTSNGSTDPGTGDWYMLQNTGAEADGWVAAKLTDGSSVAAWISNDAETAPEDISWGMAAVYPASGEPVFHPVYPRTRFLTGAIVHPPERRITGCSVFLSYRAEGGAIVIDPTLLTL